MIRLTSDFIPLCEVLFSLLTKGHIYLKSANFPEFIQHPLLISLLWQLIMPALSSYSKHSRGSKATSTSSNPVSSLSSHQSMGSRHSDVSSLSATESWVYNLDPILEDLPSCSASSVVSHVPSSRLSSRHGSSSRGGASSCASMSEVSGYGSYITDEELPDYGSQNKYSAASGSRHGGSSRSGASSRTATSELSAYDSQVPDEELMKYGYLKKYSATPGQRHGGSSRSGASSRMAMSEVSAYDSCVSDEELMKYGYQNRYSAAPVSRYSASQADTRSVALSSRSGRAYSSRSQPPALPEALTVGSRSSTTEVPQLAFSIHSTSSATVPPALSVRPDEHRIQPKSVYYDPKTDRPISSSKMSRAKHSRHHDSKLGQVREELAMTNEELVGPPFAVPYRSHWAGPFAEPHYAPHHHAKASGRKHRG